MNPMPKIGQVWESTDPRDGGRRVAVAYVGPRLVSVRNVDTRRLSTILLRRMTRSLGKRGYRLIE